MVQTIILLFLTENVVLILSYALTPSLINVKALFKFEHICASSRDQTPEVAELRRMKARERFQKMKSTLSSKGTSKEGGKDTIRRLSHGLVLEGTHTLAYRIFPLLYIGW